ncbi:MAG: BMP family ABC transporter substrate-binding protein [Butyrivibrio sp.]|nr:BMP family ABC transporter substrate-binding protein [Butyrivibrio sp.]
MNYEDYSTLVKKGQRESAAAKSAGKSPYLPVLEKLIEDVDIVSKKDLGLITIPMGQIGGTDTEGRANAFSPSGYPLLEATSEFALKYVALYNSCEEEGLRQPVSGFEYMGKYYIREGNKRVSVSKLLNLPEIEGNIIRYIPKKSDDPEVIRNYEFIEFYEKTKGINFLYFSKAGMFDKFFSLVEPEADEFTEEQRINVHSAFIRFKKAYEKKQKTLPMETADAFYTYVKLLGFEEIVEKPPMEVEADLEVIWKEFTSQAQKQKIVVSEKPNDKTVPLIKKMVIKTKKHLKIAFVHYSDVDKSSWVYSHELGRHYVEQSAIGGDIKTESFFNVSEEDADEFLEKLCEDKFDVIFTTSAQHASACTKVAISYPEVKILNCSLNDSTKFVRTYYLRTYECKFLLGMIAGALTQTGKIAYVADYPVYGTIASVNAFALGVNAVNPSARLYLSWTSKKTDDPYREITEVGCDIISNIDWSSPNNITRKFGLYANEDNPVNFAAPLWDWGKLYEAIINGIIKGNWELEEDEAGKQSLSYWWGISSGAVDLIYSRKVPPQTMRLINFMKDKICKSEYPIFMGKLEFSDGTVIETDDEGLNYIDIIEMDKLLWNIYGAIPSSDELKEENVALAKVQGALEKENKL